MTVAELIEQLKSYPDDTPAVRGVDKQGKYQEIQEVCPVSWASAKYSIAVVVD